MTVFMGDDWAEDHHDVHLMNEDGTSWSRVACLRASTGSEYFMSSSPTTLVIRWR
jgi:hypothetical protein